ncbi:MAG: hypothetical protein EBR01_04925 [Proteobacteria bacterium]|nr:hypothetical protein [Pseudomonadota bacterium]NBY20783.1 hypothetical protein [bacterium]
MYSKFFLVFFSLFLLLLSGLAETLQKKGATKADLSFTSQCRVHLTPSLNSKSNQFQLVREVLCD